MGSWGRSHRGDSLDEDVGYIDAGPRCGAYVAKTLLPGGVVAERRAVFYQPLPPADYPTSLDSGDVNTSRDCTLGMILLQVRTAPERDTMYAAIATDLRQRYPGSNRVSRHDGPYARFEVQAGTDSIVFGAGRDTLALDGPESTPTPAQDFTVFALLPSTDQLWRLGHESYDDSDPTNSESWRRAQRARFASVPEALGALMDLQVRARDCYMNLGDDSTIVSVEKLLPSLRDSAHIAAAHFLLADAYASRIEANYALEPMAHAAIQHYRIALAHDPGRQYPDGRRAFFDYWRMLAGFPPWLEHFFHFCGD